MSITTALTAAALLYLAALALRGIRNARAVLADLLAEVESAPAAPVKGRAA